MANIAPLGALAPVVFNFQSNEVRVVIRDGEPWFVAADIAYALEYRNAPDMTRVLDEDEIGTTQIVRSTQGGNPNVTIISESGLYHAILKSRKPKAKPFRRWVTSEVLPAIRKTGRYEAAPALPPVQYHRPETKDVLDVLLSLDENPAASLPPWADRAYFYALLYSALLYRRDKGLRPETEYKPARRDQWWIIHYDHEAKEHVMEETSPEALINGWFGGTINPNHHEFDVEFLLNLLHRCLACIWLNYDHIPKTENSR